MSFAKASEIIEAIRNREMVILVDDEDRENEGDLIMAAEAITPEAINFMATYGRGLICLTLTQSRCEQLNLPLMVDSNTAQFSTNFTVSIEAAEGVTTGISAADRARTVQAAVAPDAVAADLVQPGHIFPVMAQEGGVLTRAGHTEAGCDLARLGGFDPSAVIVEILNDDGTMARRDDLLKFAEKHGVKIGTIADLIEYRSFNETTIERVAHCKLPTEFGDFELHTFRDTIDNQLHYAMQMGEVEPEQPTMVRVHLQNLFNDVLHTERAADRSWNLPRALGRIASEGGVLVVLGREETNDEILAKLKNFELEDRGERPPAAKWQGTSRRVGVGSQILAQLGVRQMRLLSSQKRYHALSGFGLEVVEYISD
ncbi:bifunctional 3,4-dihydroxy-2-butanone-4-phosphate synthase/GTP cyclohydrolase II [Echinimonas agarilytica]|uniref:3,4-dihydroxy-2-butanone 4-phosphate synthase n=1 Tax=Echinimonas agarilytica TaxID=1215918 RepID=A0AA41W8M3_9GAMM|nr:bifunctional 3,4-dihydroxy-2-butanone-4-phosphate synthase/GTP cyclohydrolase II [Echinimonas agarilytica]MCM2680538.1 bifunctional 3,4-dihydroxy-2-butanone-4-phosphate synthase/GTP cyclohydrolase II [Echinimonas agarilytica]